MDTIIPQLAPYVSAQSRSLIPYTLIPIPKIPLTSPDLMR